MRPIVVIPTRLGSTRLPGKALTDINGSPMIAHVWRRGIEADIGPVVVACGDQPIVDAIHDLGGRAVLTDLEARFVLAEQHIMAGLSHADQETFRGLLAVLAKHVNAPDPMVSACDAVAEIGARASG